MNYQTTEPLTIVNAVKCVFEENTATIETVNRITTVNVDRCIFAGVSVYHRQSGVFYEFGYPTNLHIGQIEDDSVLVDEIING